MKRLYTVALSALLLVAAWESSAQYSNQYSTIWKSTASDVLVPTSGRILPTSFRSFTAVPMLLEQLLLSAPSSPDKAILLELPSPDGKMVAFRVWQNEVMAPELMAKYPTIRTLSAVAEGNSRITARLNISPQGFHAFVLDNAGAWLIDPASSKNDGLFISYYKRDYSRPEGLLMHCEGPEEEAIEHSESEGEAERINGATLKRYRLALACTEEYSAAVGGPMPTKASVLAAMVLSVNRVTGVYEREVAISLQLIGNTDTLIFLSGDPFTNGSGGTMLNQNQTVVTARIGSANYDIGHVFSTGGGGIASLGCVCSTNNKAKGVTGSASPFGDSYDIDYVAHEMGHQFNAQHTFNANTGSCSGNGVQTSAYEPGSGITIMGYAGICGGGNDLDAHSIPTFHARSLEQIAIFVTTGNGKNCPVLDLTGNAPPVLPLFSTSYNIPALTPFEIIAPEATDIDHDTLTYCWEQWNLGEFRDSWGATRGYGPIFRSFLPDTSRTRIFPEINKLLAGITSYLGEKLPDTTRRLTFRLTVRDVLNGVGSFNFADDSVVLNVIETGAPFAVTSPAANSTAQGATGLTVNWNVSGTTAAPINAASVDIYLSIDGGYTWPYQLASSTANDGSEVVTLPNVSTNGGRIKVKATGNVFFNINGGNFNISQGTDVPTSSVIGLQVYPVPATDELHINYYPPSAALDVQVSNAIGQNVWNGTVQGKAVLPVGAWARGIYYLKAIDKASGERIVKQVILK